LVTSAWERETRIHQIAAALLARGSLTGSERINKVPMR